MRNLLESPIFLYDILKRLTGEDFEIEFPQHYELSLSYEEARCANFIVAKHIWHQIKCNNAEYIYAFLDGFKEPQKQSDIRGGFYLDNYTYYLNEARKNITTADDFFKKIKQVQDIKTISDSKLCYKVLKEGNGRTLSDETQVTLKYQIYDPNNFCLAAEAEKNVNLSKTIPGFAHAVKGMRVGEKREVFIHPSLAYGVYTLLDKGIYLQGEITLLDILSEKSDPYPPLSQRDLSFVFDREFEKKLSEENRQLGKYDGAVVAEHYSKCIKVDITHIYQLLRQVQIKGCITEQNENEEDLVNKIHGISIMELKFFKKCKTIAVQCNLLHFIFF